MPLSPQSRCRGQTPRHWHDEPHRMRWRPIEQTARRLPRGFLWPRGDRGAPRSLVKPPSRGAWRCKRGRGRALPLAVRTNRNAGKRGAPKPCSRPLSDHRHAAAAALDGKRKGVIGHSRSSAAAPPVSRSEGRIAHYHLPTPPPRGRVMRPRGEFDRASASNRSGGSRERAHVVRTGNRRSSGRWRRHRGRVFHFGSGGAVAARANGILIATATIRMGRKGAGLFGPRHHSIGMRMTTPPITSPTMRSVRGESLWLLWQAMQASTTA